MTSRRNRQRSPEPSGGDEENELMPAILLGNRISVTNTRASVPRSCSVGIDRVYRPYIHRRTLAEIRGFVLTSVLTRPAFEPFSSHFAYENRRGRESNPRM